MIQPINNTLNFKGIYHLYGETAYNEKQKEVAEKIVKQFETIDASNQKGRTLAQQYKRYGYDFFIIPNDRYLDTDSVLLYATKGIRSFEKASESKINSKKMYIGNYDSSTPFNLDDIKDLISEAKQNRFLKTFIILLCGIAGLIGLKLKNSNSYSYKQKHLITDTIKINNIDTIPNTLKIKTGR